MTQIALRALLSALGTLLTQGGRRSRRFRNQVTRDKVVEVTTRDGVAHHYVFLGSTRQVISRPGRAPQPASVSVEFGSSRQALLVLGHPRPVGRLVEALLDGRVTSTGNISLLLWFHGLNRRVVPIGRHKPDARVLPDQLVAPNLSSRISDRVKREPVAPALDPGWMGATEARARMNMVRGTVGEAIPMW